MIKMFQDDELDILYLQAKSFWSKFNFKKANLVNCLNEISNAGLPNRYDKHLSNLSQFLNNLIDLNRIFVRFEEVYYEEVNQLKQNDIKQKKQITELMKLNEKNDLQLESLNKTISSYQHIQLSMLSEIEELKKKNTDDASTDTELSKPQIAPISVTTAQLEESIQQTRRSELPISPISVAKTSFKRKSSPLSLNGPFLPKKNMKKSEIEVYRRRQKPYLHPNVKQPLIQYDTFKVKCVNTKLTAFKLKKNLRKFNISQQLFAKAVLNDRFIRLFRCKPWSQCSNSQKKSAIIVHLWLNDPNGIKKLRDYEQGVYNPKNYGEQEHIKPAKLNETEKILKIEQEIKKQNQTIQSSPNLVGAYRSKPSTSNSVKRSYRNSENTIKKSASFYHLDDEGYVVIESSDDDDDNDNDDGGGDDRDREYLNQTLSYENENDHFNNDDDDNNFSKYKIIPYDISIIPKDKVINTIELVKNIKELLRTNNIHEEAFTRAVLNLHNRILSAPKPWSALRESQRQHFKRIYLFLNDSQGIDKINLWLEKNNLKNKFLVKSPVKSNYEKKKNLKKTPVKTNNSIIIKDKNYDAIDSINASIDISALDDEVIKIEFPQ